jgi:hypothetical protein
MKVLGGNGGTGAGQPAVQQTRKQGFGAHGFGSNRIRRILSAKGDLKSIDIAAGQGEGFDFGFAEAPFDGGAIANFNFVKSYIRERFHNLFGWQVAESGLKPSEHRLWFSPQGELSIHLERHRLFLHNGA